MSRGVADIEYNALNLPRRIEMASGGSIEYLYTSAGTKLAEIVRDSDGTQTKRRDYAGIFEFEDSEMKNISLASGYLTPADTTYHLYVPDHQGNIVAVYNTRSGLQEQFLLKINKGKLL